MKTQRPIISTLLLLTALLSFTGAIAQDRQFARTYQSSVLPKGSFDIEFWNTYRTGREYFYNRLDQRLEFEYGVTDKFQSAFYFNAKHKSIGSNDTNVSGLVNSSSFSFSHEMKWKLSDPSANKMGFGLYAEYTIASDEIELEGKILLDKRTEKNIFALNLVGEYVNEWTVEKGEIDIEKEIELEGDLAFMHMFKPTLGIGLELRNHNVMVENELEHAALFAGPTLFMSVEKHFVILNILPQLAAFAGDYSGLDLDEYTKVEIRLLVGFGN